jgi:ABC-2 type transport system permease protein
MYLPGGRLYRRGLYAAAALGASHAAATGKNALKVHSPFMACLLKEFRVLIRTKAYANNCVYVNLLLPVMAFGLVHFMGQKGALADFAALYREGRERAAVLLTLAVLVISFLTTALNCLASTAFTREGLHIDMMKYLPVDYRLQVLVKASVSFLITWPVLLVTVLILCSFVGAGPGDILYYAAISLMAHLLSLFAGMYLDSFSPYILWEDEYSALRGNVSSFFNMGVNMLISLLLTGVSYLLYEGLRAPLALYKVFLLLLLLGSVTLTAALCFIKTVGNVEAL